MSSQRAAASPVRARRERQSWERRAEGRRSGSARRRAGRARGGGGRRGLRARLRLLHLVNPVLHRVVLFALVAALDVLQVAHPVSRKHRVKELHRPVPPGRVLAALKAVDVELSDEGAKVVVLEVEREHVLRRAGEGSARCVLPAAASGRRGPRRCARACANLVRSTILNDSPCSLQHTRLSDAGDETISKSFIRKGATCSGARAAVGRMCGCVSRAAARRREEKGRVGVQRVVAASQGARGQRLVKLEVVHHFSRGRVAA